MRPASYAAAGVSIDAQDQAIALFKDAVRASYTPQVVTDVGSFGGMWALDLAKYRQPLLVSSVDSVGTKVFVAAQAGRHDGIGHDLVNHCVNDIAVMGAVPAFFLDYYATAKLQPAEAAAVVTGLAEACQAVGCALLGGELAELPGMYTEGVYDVAGCIVGVVERDQVLDPSQVADGDVVIGLGSSGLHTNGFSLARRLLLEQGCPGLAATVPGDGRSVAEALLAPHRCYLAAIRAWAEEGILKAAAHITGGGVLDNLPRVLPDGLGAVLNRGSWVEPPLFGWLAELGRVEASEMFHVFNMGLGLLAIVSPSDAAQALVLAQEAGFEAVEVGSVRAAVAGVIIDVGRGTPIGR